MATFEVDEVLAATQGVLLAKGKPGGRFRRVQTDSRVVKPGDLFVALKGQNFDGHEFIGKAWEKGAKGVVIEEADAGNVLKGWRRTKRNSLAVVHVKNTLRAYQDLASFHRARFSIPVVIQVGVIAGEVPIDVSPLTVVCRKSIHGIRNSVTVRVRISGLIDNGQRDVGRSCKGGS